MPARVKCSPSLVAVVLAPWKRQQRRIVWPPLTYAFGPSSRKHVFDRLGLADYEMQCDQNDTNRISPPIESDIIESIQQHCSSDDDQRVGKDKIFVFEASSHSDRVDCKRAKHRCRGLYRRLSFAP